jgi:hypothetical protein
VCCADSIRPFLQQAFQFSEMEKVNFELFTTLRQLSHNLGTYQGAEKELDIITQDNKFMQKKVEELREFVEKKKQLFSEAAVRSCPIFSLRVSVFYSFFFFI